jgi:N6-adenosine-specific RNA methylase IME4
MQITRPKNPRKDTPTQLHDDLILLGNIQNGVHLAGYSFERALAGIKQLLENDRWKLGGRFETTNDFLETIKLDNLKPSVEERKQFAVLFKEADPKTSNRKIAKTLGISMDTINRDVGANAPAAQKNPSQNNGEKDRGGANAPGISGAAAAKIVERRTNNVATTQEKRAEREATLGAKIAALPDQKFGVILADPEWHDEVYSDETGMNRHASRHYTTSSTEEIKARPVATIAADDCVLFLWTTRQHLADAIDVLRAWGFTYVSDYIWHKPSIGLGYWGRSRHEQMLIGTRGNVPCPAPGTQWDSVIDAPRGATHSAKPEIFLEMIEQYFPTIPKIELNRRGPPRPGWSAWGNEVQPPVGEAVE